jgi:hypothetical protein
MNLNNLIHDLNLTILTESKDFDDIVPTSGYASDLLSCVMAGAKQGGLWITLQAHLNIVAVASLLDLSAIIITEGAEPDEDTLAKANDQNVTLLSTSEPSYVISGKLWELGLR